MIYLNSDYTAGAHPQVMSALNQTNLLHTPGYGEDEFSSRAKRLILKECGIPDGEVFFLMGGTQTNAVVIDRLIERGEGVLATDISHIAVHEAGAIEFSGHKVLTMPNRDGKLRAAEIDRYITEFYKDDTNPHMVRPAMVYLSFPTELGSLYSREELKNIYEVCKRWEIPLYVDGARLAYGLAASADSLSLSDLSRLCDVFYIGATKCGALFGEAVVTRHPRYLKRFFTLMKMHGALLAKGRLLGVQFEALFRDGLYFRIGADAVNLALHLKKVFADHGFKPAFDSPTNQQFFSLPNSLIKNLRSEVSFDLWGPEGSSVSTIRLVTDWTTTPQDVAKLDSILSKYSHG